MLVLGSLSLLLRNRSQAYLPKRILTCFAATVVLTIGVAIVYFDQLVTASITPFMVACIVTSTVLILRPLVSALLFSITFIAYAVMISYTQTDQAILLSNRVNGLTIAAVAGLLSVIFWRATVTDLKNKQVIMDQQKKLEMLAFYDQLTGICNRHKIEEVLREELLISKEKRQACAVIMVDIDHFKPFNDANGHLAGDQVLIRVAQTLDTIAQKSGGLTGRFGGEEFLITLGNTSEDAAVTVAHQMREETEALHIENNGVGKYLTISLGVTATKADVASDAEQLIHEADRSLYKAKDRGRNLVVQYSDLVHGLKHEP